MQFFSSMMCHLKNVTGESLLPKLKWGEKEKKSSLIQGSQNAARSNSTGKGAQMIPTP